MRGTLKIRQIVVETDDGGLHCVSLDQDRLDFLVAFIQTLSEGPIRLVKLPTDVKMRPIKDMDP
ncbi:hypothetical protein [Novosphingobium sp. Leaf2]|uniref:hypothetical protein n=1 Tax=Novosphingobium sp. Leaf2 TaxID=1735670 RepID=UPI0006F77D06|nr:hypothetical protein [Novosphingobium sp. Leaf2]KQM18416.1 hypothetical protein ASE49_09400 [Novosphingobium sp. Leaf2]